MRLLPQPKLDRLDLVQPEVRANLPTPEQVKRFLEHHVEEIHVQDCEGAGVHLDYGFTNLREIQREQGQRGPMSGLTLIVQPINGDFLTYALKPGFKYNPGNPVVFGNKYPKTCDVNYALLFHRGITKGTVSQSKILRFLPGYKQVPQTPKRNPKEQYKGLPTVGKHFY